MTIDNVRQKYNMSIDDVLNVRAMCDGTIKVADDEHLEKLNRMEQLDTPWSNPTRCKVHFHSFDDPDYNRAITLYLFLPIKELRIVLDFG